MCLLIAISTCSQAQTDNYFTLSTTSSGSVPNIVQNATTNYIAVGIGTASTSGMQLGLGVSNYGFIQSGNTPSSVLGIANVVPGATLSQAQSPFSMLVARMDNSLTLLSADFSVDGYGLVSVGAPSSVYNDAHFFITDPQNDGNPLFQVMTAASVQSLVIPAQGNVGIGNIDPQSMLDVAGGVAIGSYAGSTAAPSNGLIVSGYVGIGTALPSAPLDVVGNATFENNINVVQNAVVAGLTSTTNFQMPTGAVNGYIMTTDISGNGSWTLPSSLGAGLWAASGNNIYNANTGNVGIGTSTPIASLEVSGGDAVFDASAIVHRDFYVSGTTTCFGAFNATGVASFNSDVNVNGNINASNTVNVGSQANNAGRLYLNSPALPPGAASCYILTSDPGVKAIEVQQQNQSPTTSLPYTDRFTVYADGHTVIGNVPAPNVYPVTNGYMLYVQGGVLAESFKVAPSGGPDWFDMVFDSSYALRPLADVAGYVRANHHLPEIPSADEVAKNGIDVAKMDGRLLQKVEELTLYVIQLKGEIEELKTTKK